MNFSTEIIFFFFLSSKWTFFIFSFLLPIKIHEPKLDIWVFRHVPRHCIENIHTEIQDYKLYKGEILDSDSLRKKKKNFFSSIPFLFSFPPFIKKKSLISYTRKKNKFFFLLINITLNMINVTKFALLVIVPLLIYNTIPSFTEMNFDFNQIILGPKSEGVKITSFNNWVDPIPSMLVMLDEIGWFP